MRGYPKCLLSRCRGDISLPIIVRPFSDITNTPPPSPSKAARTAARRLEDLKGFEFIEAVSRLTEADVGSFDAIRFSFVFTQLNNLIRDSVTALPAIKIASKVMRLKWKNETRAPLVPEIPDPEVIQYARSSCELPPYQQYEQLKARPAAYSMAAQSEIRHENTTHFEDLLRRVCHAWGVELEIENPKEKGKITGFSNSPFKSLMSWMAFLDTREEAEAKSLLTHFAQVFHYKMSQRELIPANTKISNGGVAVCLTGYNTHTTYAIIRRRLAIYANRGSESTTTGAVVYQIPLPYIIDKKSLNVLVYDKECSKHDYYSESELVSDFNLEKVTALEMRPQSGRFCTFASIKAASLSLLALDKINLNLLDQEPEWKRAVNEVKPLYKLFTTEYRLTILQGLLEEVERFLSSRNKDRKEAIFYSQLLFVILTKLVYSRKWDPVENSLRCALIRSALYRLAEGV